MGLGKSEGSTTEWWRARYGYEKFRKPARRPASPAEGRCYRQQTLRLSRKNRCSCPIAVIQGSQIGTIQTLGTPLPSTTRSVGGLAASETL